MSGLWTAQQREWLQAMGYRVWRLGSDEPEPAAVAEAEIRAEAPAQRPARPLPSKRALPRADGPSATPGPAPTPTGAERRLYRALLRASGQRTTRAAEALLAQLDVDLPALRGDPAAKRALWPRLRALRKASERR